MGIASSPSGALLDYPNSSPSNLTPRFTRSSALTERRVVESSSPLVPKDSDVHATDEPDCQSGKRSRTAPALPADFLAQSNNLNSHEPHSGWETCKGNAGLHGKSLLLCIICLLVGTTNRLCAQSVILPPTTLPAQSLPEYSPYLPGQDKGVREGRRGKKHDGSVRSELGSRAVKSPGGETCDSPTSPVTPLDHPISAAPSDYKDDCGVVPHLVTEVRSTRLQGGVYSPRTPSSHPVRELWPLSPGESGAVQ